MLSLGHIPKPALIMGGGAAIVVGGYAYMKHKSNSAATTPAAATDTTGIDPNTGVPYADENGSGIDPTTGVPYSEEYSSVDNGGYGVVPSALGYYDPTTGQYIGTGVGTSTVTAVSSNAAWAQQAEAYLTAQGYDGTTVSAALGKYLSGQQMTSDQAAIAEAAIAFEGNPPQPVPPITVTPPAGNGSGGGTTSAKTKTVIAPGGLSRDKLAARYKTSPQNLLKLNPWMIKYYGKAIPKGFKVKVPA